MTTFSSSSTSSRNCSGSSVREGQRAAEADAAAFVKLLDRGARSRPTCRSTSMLTMRSDFLGDCAQFRGLPEAMNESQYLIPRMNRDERRQAIEGPDRRRRRAHQPAARAAAAERRRRGSRSAARPAARADAHVAAVGEASARTARRSTSTTTRRSGRWRARCRGMPTKRIAMLDGARSRRSPRKCSSA